MPLLAIPLGVIIGLSLGALGGGGSILTVPALVYALGQDPRSATTSSLLIVGITSLLALLPHARAGRVRFAQGLLFGALGLLFSVPLLRRLHTRFHTWKAPAIALVVFVAMFSLSAFVIGPAISGSSSDADPSPVQTPDHSTHEGH